MRSRAFERRSERVYRTRCPSQMACINRTRRLLAAASTWQERGGPGDVGPNLGK